jgi:hypothetical protein
MFLPSLEMLLSVFTIKLAAKKYDVFNKTNPCPYIQFGIYTHTKFREICNESLDIGSSKKILLEVKKFG